MFTCFDSNLYILLRRVEDGIAVGSDGQLLTTSKSSTSSALPGSVSFRGS